MKKELLYLIRFMDDYIEELVYLVLDDSMDQPEYSAVTTCNLIKCYIEVMTDFNLECPYSTIREYLLSKCLSNEEIDLFEQKRQIESQYYIGDQF